MRFKDKLRVLSYVLKHRARKAGYPLAVRWNITDRCPLRCLYCDIWDNPAQSQLQELGTKEVLSIIKEIAEAGIVRMSFSGGEPMVREDIGEIITFCKKTGITPELNSSGRFISIRSGELKDVSLLKLSLDGPKEIHETVRQGSSFEEVMEAAEACAKKNIRFAFCTTINKYNVRYLNAVLDIARFYNTIAAFQPIKHLPQNSESIRDCYPSQEEFKSAVDMLILEKKRGNRHIRNSLPGLKYIYNWPEYDRLHCWARKVFCMIGPDATLYPCDRIIYTSKLPNCAEDGFKQAFNKLPPVEKCSGCGFCGSTELNFLMALNFNGTDPIRRYV